MTGNYWSSERVARAALTAIFEPGDARLHSRLEDLGAAELLAELKGSTADNRWTRRARTVQAEQFVSAANALQMRFVIPGDDEWPQQLDELDSCADVGGMRGRPIGLWARGPGQLSEYATHSIAIVGARAATNYGAAIATRIARTLSDGSLADYCVISGGAYGIDAAAHRGALENRTLGVFAGGLHEPYPKANYALFERMVAQHLVISEAPPGVGQTKPGFLARNRLIAGLAGAVIVVEAAARSGALNTTSWADALSRPVLAFPGPVSSEMSVGCHRLIRDQRAQLVCDEHDILAMLAPLNAELECQSFGERRPIDDMDRETLAVHEALPSRGTRSVDEIAVRAGLRSTQTLAILAELELLGLATRNDQQRWHLKRSVNGVIPMVG